VDQSSDETSADDGSLRSDWISTIGAGTVALGILFSIYLVVGFVHFARDTGGYDLQQRWVQENYVARGVNPHLVYPKTVERTGNEALVDPEIGLSLGVSYPPWSYALNMLLVPPIAWPWTKAYYAMITLSFLVLQGWWVYQLAAAHKPVARLFLVFACLALYANFMGIAQGQHSIAINFGIASMLLCLRRERPVLAGLAFCLAMVKPQTTLLLILVPIVKGDWRCVATAGLLLTTATLAVAGWVGDWPHAMLLQVLEGAGDFGDDINRGLPHLLTRAGLESDPTVPGLVFFGLLTAALVYRYRDVPTLQLVAIPLVMGQLWSYSRRYDHSNLYVLVAVLGLLALDGRNHRYWAAFLLVGASLWLPTTAENWVLWLPLLQFSIWLGALFVLFSERSRLDARALWPAEP
jgi:hypothetical protein